MTEKVYQGTEATDVRVRGVDLFKDELPRKPADINGGPTVYEVPTVENGGLTSLIQFNGGTSAQDTSE